MKVFLERVWSRAAAGEGEDVPPLFLCRRKVSEVEELGSASTDEDNDECAGLKMARL